jgi:hypothetical protein
VIQATLGKKIHQVPPTMTLDEAFVTITVVVASRLSTHWHSLSGRPTLSKASLSSRHLTLGEASFAEF